jgi:hypothetical protein
MESLGRLIKKWNQEAADEWMRRYGHGYPIYAIIDGNELKIT